ncbi:DUF4363 family protein [Candidatus Arthromitus sp. SFB-turkey]|uniref:DUF4363 family protein n=1 Tax=Candidatus Arthromitus sp. SFB-turkey TaxID=1840217 RepID=UPI0007F34769|nr:DUF4363 family protein [Candidatus Arthromitus sp. SFB-turkey]OAT87155.1 hypothetical protein A6P36_06860 [Candidatus Arthromitus sp. SFB-turkey]
MKLNIKNISVYGLYSILLVFTLILFFNLKFSTNKMIKDLEIITPYIKNENWETSKLLFHNFNKNYKNKLENFSIILNHKEINEALLSITDIFTNIELKNKELCLNKIENLKFHITNFFQSQVPSIKNIL